MRAKKNRLFLLKIIGDHIGDWDIAEGFVVRANSQQKARELAAESCGDEKADTWLDSAKSTCVDLESDGEAGVVLVDFKAG
jgi:hypothetical protein